MQVGQVVAGKYRVDYLAGRGGMAAVWAGTNERTGKRVALKVILQSMAATNDAQLGEVIGKSVGAVKQLQRRALIAIRLAIEERRVTL